jgi:polysaccharide export outer membrane protein
MRRLVIGLLSACALLAPAAAQEPGDSFWEGDLLTIHAYGRDDLTGQHSVQPGRVLTLPLIGAVDLSNLTPRQLEAELAKAWENRLGQPMSVTVEFAERAPVYVLGDVNSPGAYPYRAGMTVMQAVAVGGGFENYFSSDARFRMDVLRERERHEQATEKMARALAMRARLTAERDGLTEVSLAEPFDLVDKARMDGLLAREAELMRGRTGQDAIKETLLAEQVRLGEEEIASYQAQYEALTGQQQAAQKEANRIRRVPGQQNRAFELEQRASTLEASKVAIQANIARSRINTETARNGIADMRETRRQEITAGFMEADQMFEEGSATQKATSEILRGAGYAGGSEPVMEFSIYRRGETTPSPASPGDAIRPGDLVEVELALPEAKPDAITTGGTPPQTAARPPAQGGETE